MHTTDPFTAQTPPADAAWLWARAAKLIATMISFIGSPAQLIRSGGATHRERRELNFMIAPIEALVRSLLMADAIAWLTGTEEGAETLRAAAAGAFHSAPKPVPRHAAATRTTSHVDPSTNEISETKITTDTENTNDTDATNLQVLGAPASHDITDAEIAKILAPGRLRFQAYEAGYRSSVVSGRTRSPAATARPPRARVSRTVLLARRIEALRRIIADPRSAMLALAHDLATRQLGSLYVPSPRNWIDERWVFGRSEIREARARPFALFCDFEKLRNGAHAIPPPEPG